MVNNSHDKAPAWRNRITAMVAIGATAFGGALVSGCTTGEKPTPVATATQSGGETPSAEVTPSAPETDKTIWEQDWKGKTDKDLYQIPDNLTSEYIVAHRDEIPELFAISEEEANTPEGFVTAVFDRQNAFNRLGTDQYTIDESNKGNGTVVADRLDDYVDGWRAMNNLSANQEPAKNARTGVAHVMLARLGVELAAALADVKAEIPTVAVATPDMDTLMVTENPDGTTNMTVLSRDYFDVDNKAAYIGANDEFNTWDMKTTTTFNNCGPTGKGTFACKSVATDTQS